MRAQLSQLHGTTATKPKAKKKRQMQMLVFRHHALVQLVSNKKSLLSCLLTRLTGLTARNNWCGGSGCSCGPISGCEDAVGKKHTVSLAI